MIKAIDANMYLYLFSKNSSYIFLRFMVDNGLAGNGVSPLSRLVMNLLYPLCLL